MPIFANLLAQHITVVTSLQHEERKEERKRRHRERGERNSKEESERIYHTISSPTDWTKVFYYITGDKMETPYVTAVPRK